MIQNHCMQLLALVAMEPPATFGADAVRDEKLKVLRSIPPMRDGRDRRRHRARPVRRRLDRRRACPGYRRRSRASRPTSRTETFVALKLQIDNWRWAGVPFYLRTGKRLTKRITEVAIQFKRPPYLLFRDIGADQLQPNVLSLRIQPNEGISLRFGPRCRDRRCSIRPVNMEFFYGRAFGVEPPEAYERLLLDCMHGDSTLFTRRDETELAWGLVDSIAHAWDHPPATGIPRYEPGTSGPREADTLIERDERTWRRL